MIKTTILLTSVLVNLSFGATSLEYANIRTGGSTVDTGKSAWKVYRLKDDCQKCHQEDLNDSNSLGIKTMNIESLYNTLSDYRDENKDLNHSLPIEWSNLTVAKLAQSFKKDEKFTYPFSIKIMLPNTWNRLSDSDTNEDITTFKQEKENSILSFYKELKERKLDENLTKVLDPEELGKLLSSKGEIEYSKKVLTALQNIQSELLEDPSDEQLEDPSDEKLNIIMEKIKYMMYAWTLPYEILSTKNILNNSLFEKTKEFYKNEQKKVYSKYAKFIYSLMYHKDMDDINLNFSKTNKESFMDTLKGSLADVDHKFYINAITNNMNNNSIIFSQEVDALYAEDFLLNANGNHWYSMIKVYMKLQNNFYDVKKEIYEIIKILNRMENKEEYSARLELELDNIDYLFRNFDALVRFNIIDLPIILYIELYKTEFQQYLGVMNDNERMMSKTLVLFNKSCANLQKYVSSNITSSLIVSSTKEFKDEFNDDEWQEIIIKAKMTQDWFKMLNKIESNK